MNDNSTSEEIQSLHDTVKWVGTSVISIGIAISGAAVLARLGAASIDNRKVAVVLATVALVAIVSEAALSVWALSARDPSLADLMPELEGLTDTAVLEPAKSKTQNSKISKRRRRLAHDIAKAAPVAQFKYRTLADLGAELQRRRAEWLKALTEADSPSAIGDAWKKAIPKLGEDLESAYADLREVTQGLELVRTRRRAGIAIPLTALLGVLVVAAMVPFVLFTQPQPSRLLAAPVTSAVPVNVQFAVNPSQAESPKGCIPNSKDHVVAAGGSWSRPLLIFTANKSRSKCLAGSIWLWYPRHQGEVVITPINDN